MEKINLHSFNKDDLTAIILNGNLTIFRKRSQFFSKTTLKLVYKPWFNRVKRNKKDVLVEIAINYLTYFDENGYNIDNLLSAV